MNRNGENKVYGDGEKYYATKGLGKYDKSLTLVLLRY